MTNFLMKCIGFYPDDDNPKWCAHYRMGLCDFFEKNDAPIECDDTEEIEGNDD